MKLTIDAVAGPDALAELAADLHPDDAAELKASGLDLAQGIPAEFQALRWGGKLVALFGLAEHPQGPAFGVPWMLCTNVLGQVPARQMVDVSANVVWQWKARCTALQNLVHRRNARALRFIRWLGFTVDTTPCGPGGEFFCFTWSRL